MGFDPGTRKTGYAVLCFNGASAEVLDFGAWVLIPSGAASKINSLEHSLGGRLEKLYALSSALIQKWNPHWVGLEWVVSHKNVSSSLKLSEARGVLRLAMHQQLQNASDRLIEISPTEVKKKISGMGQAQKKTVEKLLHLRLRALGLSLDQGKEADAYDAIAIAWTAWMKVGKQQKAGRQIKELR